MTFGIFRAITCGMLTNNYDHAHYLKDLKCINVFIINPSMWIGTISIVLILPILAKGGWKVVNGNEAIRHEFPEIASISFFGNHFCGGTLINKNTVLTAAHCIWPIKDMTKDDLCNFQVKVTFGLHDLVNLTGQEHSYMVVKMAMHPTYEREDSFKYGNDVALLKIDSELIETDLSFIKYAILPQDEISHHGQQCQVVGWGSTNPSNDEPAHILQKGTLDVISNDECSDTFGLVRFIPSSICAVDRIRSVAACVGDSGGPLFCRDQFNRNVQVGIVSSGYEFCGSPNIPSVFTRVSSVYSWILEASKW